MGNRRRARRRPVEKSRAACAFLLWLLAGASAGEGRAVPDQAPEEAGVVVVDLGRGSALAAAGVRVGDLLISWERRPDPPAEPERQSGELGSVFDWLWLVTEQAPRGTVGLGGEREGERLLFSVAPGPWEATVRPRLPGGTREDYLEGEALSEAGEPRRGIELWQRAARSAGEEGSWHLRCWLHLEIGNAWAGVEEWEPAHAAYRTALGEARSPTSRAVLWDAIAAAHQGQGELAMARQAYGEALDVREAAWGESLSLAANKVRLGEIAWYLRELETAEQLWEQSLIVREKLAPDSLEVVESLNNLGVVAHFRGDLESADGYHRRAVATIEKLAPDSLAAVETLGNMGSLAWSRGELEMAEDYQRRALKICEKAPCNDLSMAFTLNNLGVIAIDRGAFESAEDYLQRGLALREKLAPGSFDVAYSLNNLGVVATERGELRLAEDYHQRALTTFEELAPGSLDVKLSLNNLGAVALKRGELELAQSYHQRALAIAEKQAPASSDLAISLNQLGAVASRRGELELARSYHQRALAIVEKLAPEGVTSAVTSRYLGVLAAERGELELARSHLDRALEIQQKLAPEGTEVARSLWELGALLRRGDRPQLAAGHFRRAIDALEAQTAKLGGSQDVKGGFRSQFRGLYRDLIEVLLESGLAREAFHVLERSRARSFLEMLAERDLAFSTDVSAELDRARRRLAVVYDRLQQQLAGLDSEQQGDEVDALLEQLRQLRREREEIVEQIRRDSPYLAALQYPQPLDLGEVRETLDPGTALLSFSVGEEQTDLFVVTREGGLEVHSLAIGSPELRGDVERFRELIRRPPWSRRRANFEELGRRLYETLISPAAAVVDAGERLLIVPDGPLHLLPWSALPRAGSGGGVAAGRDAQYLVEWKPLHSVLSATVYAELRKLRRPPGPSGNGPSSVLLAAFGDPRYPREEGALDSMPEARARSAVQRGLLGWQPLPHSRREVEQIAGLYPSQATRVYLGEAATEERAKAIGRETRIVHFAVHSHLDDLFPLDSGLALTIPNGAPEVRDNGLLQAWEVYEGLRIDADLVVLSACESALGQEQGGEGLIGLTRAFQYAGARSVAATLWSVGDQVTAELMVRFYRHLRAGFAKDVALRAAQTELIRGPIQITTPEGKRVEVDASAPYHWAAFQLIGDWR